MINFDILRRACKTDEEREAIATLERTVNQIRDMPPEKRAAWEKVASTEGEEKRKAIDELFKAYGMNNSGVTVTHIRNSMQRGPVKPIPPAEPRWILQPGTTYGSALISPYICLPADLSTVGWQDITTLGSSGYVYMTPSGQVDCADYYRMMMRELNERDAAHAQFDLMHAGDKNAVFVHVYQCPSCSASGFAPRIGIRVNRTRYEGCAFCCADC
jgi:hypothetical protein